MLATIVLATLSALSNACAAVLQRLAVVDRTSTTAKSAWRTAIDLVRQPVWLLGGLFLVATFGFQALALYFGPLSVVQPVLVLELIFTLGLRVFLLHDDIASRTWSAALVICLGLAAFLVLASPSEGTHVPNAAQWILAVSTRALAVLAGFSVLAVATLGLLLISAATPLWLIAVILAGRSATVGLIINPLLQALVQPLRPDQLGDANTLFNT